MYQVNVRVLNILILEVVAMKDNGFFFEWGMYYIRPIQGSIVKARDEYNDKYGKESNGYNNLM